MVTSVKREIAHRAQQMGFRFDDSEIVDVIENGYCIVFLRSIKAHRQIELSDGTFADEEYNDPIIWLDHYPVRCEIDREHQKLNYIVPLPKLNILYPELIRKFPIQPTSAPS